MQNSLGKFKKNRSTYRRPISLGSYHPPYFINDRNDNYTNRLEYKPSNDYMGRRSYRENDDRKLIKQFDYKLGRDKLVNQSGSTAQTASASELDILVKRPNENNIQARSQNSGEQQTLLTWKTNLTPNTEFFTPLSGSILPQQSLGVSLDTPYQPSSTLPNYVSPVQDISHDGNLVHSSPTLTNNSDKPFVGLDLGLLKNTEHLSTLNIPNANQFHQNDIKYSLIPNQNVAPLFQSNAFSNNNTNAIDLYLARDRTHDIAVAGRSMRYGKYASPSFDHSYRYGASNVPGMYMDHSVHRGNTATSSVYYPAHPYIRSAHPLSHKFPANTVINSALDNSSDKTNAASGECSSGSILSQETDFYSMYRLIKRNMLPTLKKKLTDALTKNAKGLCTTTLYLLFYHKDIKVIIEKVRNGFIAIFNIGEAKFSSHARNKRSAREKCTRKILNHLLQYESHILTVIDKDDSIDSTISHLIFDACDRIMEDKLYIKRSKVLAGIVVIKDKDYKSGDVIAFSTGSKCFGEDELPLDGSKIIDSHAEILVSRGFRVYLMDQLNLLMEKGKENESIFKPVPVNDKYVIKEGISFALYISGPPCGDCRLFTSSKGEVRYGKGTIRDKHPERQTRGVLRVKIQTGHGGLPVKRFKPQSSEGKNGKPKSLITMSCSDKLLRMNLLGVQGALLSSLIAPIYYSKIVIGDSFDINGARRALYGRIMDLVPELPVPHVLNKPVVLKSTSKPSVETPKDFKFPRTCVNWVVGHDVEFLECSNGVKTDFHKSQLCKYMMLKNFLTYIIRSNNPTWINNKIFPGGKYIDFKKYDINYAKVKELLYEMFVKLDMGEWYSMKPKYESFSVEIDVNNENQ